MQCTECNSVLTPKSKSCPSCGQRIRKKYLRLLISGAAGSAVGITLMACYGMPPCDYGGAKNDGHLCNTVTDGMVCVAPQIGCSSLVQCDLTTSDGGIAKGRGHLCAKPPDGGAPVDGGSCVPSTVNCL